MRFVRISAALAMTMLVAACFFTPGKFDARMTVMRDGTFTYRYTGEILMVTGQSMMGAIADREMANETFDPEAQTCHGEPGSATEPAPARSSGRPTITLPTVGTDDVSSELEGRDCTAAELEAKRREWESARAERQARNRQQKDAMKAMFGGIDPSDPATMTEFARRLEGQGGWKKVVHKGNGLFDVVYEISGRLDHDFVFPLFPNMDFIIPFVQAAQYGGGKVRIIAPALVRPGSGMGGMNAQALGAAAAMTKGGDPWPFKAPEGSFTLTTDGSILTNNTRDGPVSQGGVKVLTWRVSALDTAKPEALIQF
jgi:hypothetical protein